MNTGELVQVGALVVLFVLGMVGFQRFRDAGAASIPDERPPLPKRPGDDAGPTVAQGDDEG